MPLVEGHRFPGGSRQKKLSDSVLEGLLCFISPFFTIKNIFAIVFIHVLFPSGKV